MAVTVVSSAPCRCCHSACCDADGPPSVDVTVLTVADQYAGSYADSMVGRLFNLPRHNFAGRLHPAFQLVTYDYHTRPASDPPQEWDSRTKLTVAVRCETITQNLYQPGTYETKAALAAAVQSYNVQFGYGWGITAESEVYNHQDDPWDSPSGWYPGSAQGSILWSVYSVQYVNGFPTYYTRPHVPCTEPLNINNLEARGNYYGYYDQFSNYVNGPDPARPITMTALITAGA